MLMKSAIINQNLCQIW